MRLPDDFAQRSVRAFPVRHVRHGRCSYCVRQIRPVIQKPAGKPVTDVSAGLRARSGRQSLLVQGAALLLGAVEFIGSKMVTSVHMKCMNARGSACIVHRPVQFLSSLAHNESRSIAWFRSLAVRGSISIKGDIGMAFALP